MDDDDIDWGIKMLLQENRDLKFKFTSLESENAKLREQTRWIPVSERLPTHGEWVLMLDKNKRVNDYKFIDEQRVPYSRWFTHWMPRPELPGKGGEA